MTSPLPSRGHGRAALAGAAVAVVVASLASTPGHAAATVSVATPGTATYTIHHPDPTVAGAHSAVEPSIGASFVSGAVMYQADVTTFRVHFDDSVSPARATWTDVSSPLTSVTTLDPILFTDPVTGRTFVSQLDVACSLQEFSDNDGASWTPSNGCAQNVGEDHQSVGGGPFHVPAPAAPVYPHAVYYCNQDGGVLVAGGSTAAYCGLSVTGGLTYLPGHPIYSFQQCGGLHGHIRVGPDGTAVVPNQNCGPAPDPTATPPGTPLGGTTFPNQAAVVSTDNGTTWAVHVIPGSNVTLRSDPSVAFDAADRMYFGFEDGVYANGDVTGEQIGGRAMIASSPDGGTTWTAPVDVGAPFGIRNVTFPEVIAGDAGRVAYAFLGSTTAGDPEKTTFQGLWHLYLAQSSDAGASWTVQDLTPGDPVERGCTYLAGTGDCPNPAKRNLYDFMDITRDAQGRVLIGFAKGCTGTCVTQQTAPCTDPACSTGSTASTDRFASIARETCGPSLTSAGAAALACTGAPTTAAGSAPVPSPPTTAAAAVLPNTGGPGVGMATATCGLLGAVGLRRRLRPSAP